MGDDIDDDFSDMEAGAAPPGFEGPLPQSPTAPQAATSLPDSVVQQLAQAIQSLASSNSNSFKDGGKAVKAPEVQNLLKKKSVVLKSGPFSSSIGC